MIGTRLPMLLQPRDDGVLVAPGHQRIHQPIRSAVGKIGFCKVQAPLCVECLQTALLLRCHKTDARGIPLHGGVITSRPIRRAAKRALKLLRRIYCERET